MRIVMPNEMYLLIKNLFKENDHVD